MRRFIDDKTVFYIVYENVNDVKEIIETTMKVSPFGKRGKRTIIVKYKNLLEELKYIEIDEKLYEEVYNKLNKQ